MLLYLNNDIELGFAAIEQAIARLHSDTRIGAVGGKVIRTHGRLQEAGSIIWRDGTTIGYMRDASPLAPEANFVRDVDYCSGVFLLCRTDVVRELGGFDEDYSPAYYEEVDLCVRMAERGLRVVYDPGVVIHHLEFGSAANVEASMALMRRGHKIFERKHAAYLETRFAQGAAATTFARHATAPRKRVLFLEDTIPVRRLGSGFVRSNDAACAIAAAGCDLAVYPINGARHDMMSMYADLPETAEVLHDRTILTLPEFLEERRGYYDLIWVSRTHNLGRVLPIFEDAGVTPETIPFVLDTEAIVTQRDAALAAFHGNADSFDFDAALRAEFAEARGVSHICAVNDAEVGLLRNIGFEHVSMLGTVREPEPTPASFAEREGLLFLASIHQPDSPNYDSLFWLLDDILPALEAEMETPPLLTFIGYCAPDIDLSAFQDDPRIRIVGAVGDTRPYYNSSRLFVAPTRFSAGTPYKVYETASFGLPCIATDLLARQLGWNDGSEIAVAPTTDAKRFAAQIARLYQDEAAWTAMREAALDRLARENGAAAFNATVSGILEEIFAKRQAQALQLAS